MAMAQLSVNPLVVFSEASRGRSQGFITLINTSNQEFRARVYALPFTYDRDSGFQVIEKSENDLTPYLLYGPRELIMPPKTTRRVRYVATIPPSKPQGEYRAIIYTEKLEESKDTSSAGSAVTIQRTTRIGTTLYVRSGKLTTSISIGDIQYSQEDKSLKLLLENVGTATVRPYLKWDLMHNGQKFKSGRTESHTIISKKNRFLPIETSEVDRSNREVKRQPLPSGSYQLIGKAIWHNLDQEEQQDFSIDFQIP